jgi:hypothetical protein
VKQGNCTNAVLYLPISLSSVRVLMIAGTLRCNLIVSLSTHSKYFISFMSLITGPLKCGLLTLHTLCHRAKNADATSYPVNSIFSPIGIWGSSCVVFTNAFIPYTLNHPTQHKYATVKFLYNRLNTYDLQGDEYRREEKIIHNIMHKNSFPIHLKKTHNPKSRKHQPNTQATAHKWATFTYTGKETTLITNTLRRINLKIALCTVNTIHNALTRKNQTIDKYPRSGVYKLTCPDCKKAYVGQTGRSLQHGSKSTKTPLKTTATHRNMPNILLSRITLSTPSKTLCKCYSTKTEGRTSTSMNASIFTRNI